MAVVIDHRDQVEELLADYRRSREQLASVHRSLSSINEKASSPDGLVTATVGPHGNLTGLAIADGAYQRYRPEELGELITHLVAVAAGKAADRAGAALAPVLPAGADPAALLAGTADLRPEEYAPAESPTESEPTRGPNRHRVVEHEDDSFEEMTWMDSANRGRPA